MSLGSKTAITRDFGRVTTARGKARRALAAVGGGRGGFLALGLLKAQGVEVKAFHIHVRDFPEVGYVGTAVEVSEEVCRKLQVPLEVVDATDLFEAAVIDATVHAALLCREPEPYRAWTQGVLFPQLFEAADRMGFETIVTGHFAQSVHDLARDQYLLQPAVDQTLDQSHHLACLSSENVLRRLVTPLGSLAEVMLDRLAREISLPPTAAQSIPAPGFTDEPWHGSRDWIEHRVAVTLRPHGVVRSQSGALFGEHNGLFRQAYGVRPTQSGILVPDEYVVTGFDNARTATLVGLPNEMNRPRVMVRDLEWSRKIDGLRGIKCEVRLGPGRMAEARITVFEGSRAEVAWTEGTQALVPGRTLVFYEGGEVLGCGRMEGLE